MGHGHGQKRLGTAELEHGCNTSFVNTGECSISTVDVSDMDKTSIIRLNDVGCHRDF